MCDPAGQLLPTVFLTTTFSAMQAGMDFGKQFLLLHAPPGSSTPPVLPLLSAALRAHVDVAATAGAAAEPRACSGELGRHAAPAGRAQQRVSKFHALSTPQISVEAYLERVFKYTKCSPVCLVSDAQHGLKHPVVPLCDLKAGSSI